ncbi:MAG: hypothetical protein GC154_00905 [bacterium]|nr:hypothetical protein [bacterium]
MRKPISTVYTDELCKFLDELCITRTSFEEMAGTPHPWEACNGKLIGIQKQFRTIENDLRESRPTEEIACIYTGEGAFWLGKNETDRFIEHLDRLVDDLTQSGPMPMWNFTSAEIFTLYLNHLRRLILAITHEKALLPEVKDSLGPDGEVVWHELNRAVKTLENLVADVRHQAPNVTLASMYNVMLYERSRITLDLLQNQHVSEEDLGYDRATLKRAQEVLERRCQMHAAHFRPKIQAFYNHVREALRHSETLQLVLTSRWDLSISEMVDIPLPLVGSSRILPTERRGLTSIVQSRESELGPSAHGATALEMAEKAEHAHAKKHREPTLEERMGAALTDEEIKNLLKSDPGESESEYALSGDYDDDSKKKSNVRRMAFTSASGRRR